MTENDTKYCEVCDYPVDLTMNFGKFDPRTPVYADQFVYHLGCEDGIFRNKDRTMTQEPPESAQLCYVEHGTAYFTTQPLNEQWGDDWNDAPYEHNAGAPYGTYRERGSWEVYPVKFDTYFREPKEGHRNSPYSVEDINREKAIPWLRSETWDDRNIKVWAGATFDEFRAAVEESGGQVYLPE